MSVIRHRNRVTGLRVSRMRSNPKVVLILHLRAPNTPSGNPNRLYVAFGSEGQVVDMVDEGYSGLPKGYAGVPVYSIEVTASEIRGWKEDYGEDFNTRARRNPRRVKSNPPLVTFGNPNKCMSDNVVEIRYQHNEDGQYYKHKFKRGQVRLHASAGSKAAVLKRVDGKPLISDY